MKNACWLLVSLLAVLLLSCGSSNNSKPQKVLPAPGTLIDSMSAPITEDKLNNFHFSVVIRADSSINEGVYDVCAAYGYDIAKGTFTMPKGMEDYQIMLRKGTKEYSYIIGFKQPHDTSFYEYFGVTGERNKIEMQYLKAYMLK